jgi:hypothetical protein
MPSGNFFSPLHSSSAAAVNLEHYGRICAPIISLRSGPDVLHPSVFEGAERVIGAVMYWYRNHVRCHDADCRCVFSPRQGDGLCVLALRDGLFSCSPLTHLPSEDPLHWEHIRERGTLMSRGELERIRASWSFNPVVAALRWREPGTAFAGVNLALSAAEAHGVISPWSGPRPDPPRWWDNQW